MNIENKVFIILINYNGWKDTLQCVKSLFTVIKSNISILVVDNKSTDDSYEKLRSQLSASVILLEADENKGFSAGNNLGISYAMQHGADYVLLLNNDTISTIDFITPMVEFAQNHEDCGAITCRIYYWYDKNRLWYDGGTFHYYKCRAEHYRFGKYESDANGINKVGFISGCCMLIPINVIRKVGMMDENFFLYVEDTEYSLRIINGGYALYYDAEGYLYHKVSATTGKNSAVFQYYDVRNHYYVMKKYLSSIQQFTSQIYNFVFLAYKILCGKYDWHIVKLAIHDAYKGVIGKRRTNG